jgi:hypothetical protein
MSAEHDANKGAIRRFHDAANSGDLELISRTIDELVEPDRSSAAPQAAAPTRRASRMVSSK